MFNQFSPYPQMMSPMMPQSSSQSLTRVNGIDGAKSYQIGAGQSIALFDSNEDLFYLKSCDNAGFPTIRIFRFEEITNFSKNSENVIDTSEFITKKEMEEYVKQFIQSAGKTDNASNK